MTFECRPDCGVCCPCVPVPVKTFLKHCDDRQRKTSMIIPLLNGWVIPMTKDLKCVYLTEGKRCAIYEDRPPECRRYGTRKGAKCPYLHPDGTPRTQAGIKKILGENEFFDGFYAAMILTPDQLYTEGPYTFEIRQEIHYRRRKMTPEELGRL